MNCQSIHQSGPEAGSRPEADGGLLDASCRSAAEPTASRQAQSMTAADGKVRLAIGVFHELPRLDRAVTELAANGMGTDDICLVGTPEAFVAAGSQDSEDALPESFAVPALQLHNLGRIAGDYELSASSGALLRTILRQAKWGRDDGGPSAGWLWPELCARLADHLRLGALVVIVNTPTFSLQRQCSRILLRHSAHTVQTHEFTSSG